MAGKKKPTQSKNSRSSRKVTTSSYEKKTRPIKEFIWLEEGSPRQREVHKMCEIIETKKQFGKTYFKYSNPKLMNNDSKVEDCDA